ncbi:MFS transporter [Phytohalomonas tamaricis]|uniref:MFS transporter n=1 Tax=Phytohalomonas tamaricis TaxID=2081032 RepID=UPI000D0B6EF3|nr:MFS transporter [Phytohalomonas tamaricis]
MEQQWSGAHGRQAVRWVFLGSGVATACWAPMVPYAKTRLALGDATLGLILLALGGGGMVLMPLSGMLVRRWGSRPVMMLSGATLCITLPTLALAPSAMTLALALFAFGALIGMLDVSMNAQAVAVEARSPKPVMSSFHGFFSLGGLLGAGLMSALLWVDVPLWLCALMVGCGVTLLVLGQWRRLLPSAADKGRGDAHFALPRGVVIILGILCFIAFLAEGAILDWSAVFLRFSRDVSVSLAGLGFALFSLTMTVGRLSGDWLTSQLGPVRLLRWGALLAAAGYVLALATPWAALSLIGFMLVGLGLANLVPILFSAAGRLPDMAPSMAIAAVSTLGYAGLLAGPAGIGGVAELTSLATALALIAVALVIVALSAAVVRR